MSWCSSRSTGWPSSASAREGWRTRHFWRGPSPAARLFELYEFSVEIRVMPELATDNMLAAYTNITNGRAQRAILAAQP